MRLSPGAPPPPFACTLPLKVALPPESALSVRLRDVLRSRIGKGEVRAVSCQDPTDKQRFRHWGLCGTKNTQGRHLAGQVDLCGSGQTGVSPRFLHVEQRFDPVLNDAALRGLVVEAASSLAPCLSEQEARCR